MKKHRQMGNEPGFIWSKIQMSNCAYVLTNLERPSDTETHHLTRKKFNKYEAFQRKHFDWCGLFSDGGTSQRNFPPVLRKTRHVGYSLCICKANGVTCCLGLLSVNMVSTTDLESFSFSCSVKTFKILKTSCSSVGATWDLLKFLRKMRKRKKNGGFPELNLIPVT